MHREKVLIPINLTKIPTTQLNLMHIAAFFDSLECLVLLHQEYNMAIDLKSPVFLIYL